MTAAELPRDRRRLVDAIQVDAARDFLDPVDDVVERRGEIADVLAVEGRHEGAVQGAKDLVRDLVAHVLDVLEVARFALDVDEIGEQVVQQSRAFKGVGGAAIEEVEEAVILGDQSQAGEHGRVNGPRQV